MLKNKNSFKILGLYVFHMAFVLLSYFLANDITVGFHYTLIFHTAYLIFWGLTKIKDLKSVHLLLLGLLYIGSPPLFENDHYRYIWEGKVILAGENPYQTPPSSEKLKHIEFEHKDKIGYPYLTSVYPPLAQLFFSIVAPLPFNLGLIFLQLLSLLMLYFVLFKSLPFNQKYLILILPYFYKEFVQSIHIDIIAISFLILFMKRKSIYSGIIFSFLSKIISMLIIPFALIKSIYQKEKILLPLIGLSTCLLLAAFAYTKLPASSGASAFITYWHWNSPIGYIIDKLGATTLVMRLIMLGLFSLSYFSLIFYYLKTKAKNFRTTSATVYMFLYLFSPVMHPWYLAWPFIFQQSNKFYYYFVFSSFFSYSAYGMPWIVPLGLVIQFILLLLAIKSNLVKLKKA